ncbi:helix-turn-helix transcriptional regulator [Pseudoflavitalea sp. G-6-1-2]|uniref:winged helix-turn-helix transcriptional regulator n=1 Tax=Pseudoflavitalea sp. G-6-1-2 TaxID=2728841 RepID=UPI00146D0190|nr:helix-turn-helix domain-containing protein [Pseudoflavitalea sp. G-6-1-2]NML22371.1 helix-turn-helix transcriptional regulator [Pseudoflavitalea sp. G-6-1-2]
MADRKLNSTYSRNEQVITDCDLTYAIHIIGGRWKLQILSSLKNQKMRFTDLKKKYALITERMLTLQLRAMEKDGLIKRVVYAEVPPRVEYELTELACRLTPILDQLSDWGQTHKHQTENKNEDKQ